MSEIQRMWPGGPLRQWHPSSHRGSYVCDGCHETVAGVYYVSAAGNWVCKACKAKVRKKTTKPNGGSAQGAKHG
jgi:ribosomal protein L37AE/L43A